MRLRLPLKPIVRIRNIALILIIFMILYLHVSYKINAKLKKCSRKAKTENLRTKSSPVTINLERIRMFYSKSRDFFIPTSLKRIDWHNYTLIAMEKERKGIGEQGQPGFLPEGRKFKILQSIREYGHNTALSEKLSLQRSVVDTRHRDCKKRLYIESLPTVSVIIVYYKGFSRTIIRSVISVLNRSQGSLLKEIFLVDYGSTEAELQAPLDKYVEENMWKTKIVRLTNCTGVVGARLAGAKLATADVLVFLDSHIEVNVNWLPPLLEPIALDYQTAVVPILDTIWYYSLEYSTIDDGGRGSFDWWLNYQRLFLTPKDESNLPEPFETPVMRGIFAISRHFFWELGGYDPGLKNWGGEQLELSFKIWQCGGRILEAPCSRVGHVFADRNNRMTESLTRNHKRIAEVWMDEYAKYVYARNSDYNDVDPGDLTEQKALRQRLNCKPFKWFMTQIAFDLCQQFLPVEPPPYAKGRIRPRLDRRLCVDGNYGQDGDVVQLNSCHDAEINPKDDDQKWIFTWYNDIRLTRGMCLDVPESDPGGHIRTYACHRRGGNQQWKYDLKTKHLHFLGLACLDFNPKNRDLFVNRCNNRSLTQLWEFDYVNKKQLKKWNATNTHPVTAPVEDWKV